MCTVPVHGWISNIKFTVRRMESCARKEVTVQLFIDTEGMLMVDPPDYYKEWQARYRERNDNHP